jgi:D-alanyl-D-alanine carboxypeptidase (penicillin-binding protein 5/6)
MFAAIHSRVAVQDLLRGLVILNANDGAIALGEGISGNERGFTELMTKRAREIGLTDATFANASGLPDLANQMSVREMAKLARFIIKTYPEQYKLFNERDFTWNKIHQTNRNALLNALTSADGLKTGFSKDGGYGMVGSAVQNGIRLIVAINGVEDPDDRLTEGKKLLEWGFRNFEVRHLFEAGQIVGYAKVFGGQSSSVALTAREPVGVMVQKSGADKLLARITYTGPVRAPVDSGQLVGTVRVWRGPNVAVEVPVYASESVGTGSMTRRAFDTASELVIGWLRAGVGKL